ncbi:hypothetical protein DM860_004008 [Cuscuta australis]|uniref:Uncharacterized protein n=1 Tax=Cuscuta australis TaxID=267555 RepID=A0A328CVU1_9ASTE|nr:hypothetical protein DM860_004008 [Cuscuta australis]
MAASDLRPRSCSFAVLLISFLNFILFVLSAASIAPIFLIKNPPTSSLAYAFLVVSSISLLSSLAGFCSQFCPRAHTPIILASSLGQLLAVLTLLAGEGQALGTLKSQRDPREAKVLVRLECAVMVAMFVAEVAVLVLSCAVERCCMARERDEGGTAAAEAAKDDWGTKRSQWMAKVQDEEEVKRIPPMRDVV